MRDFFLSLSEELYVPQKVDEAPYQLIARHSIIYTEYLTNTKLDFSYRFTIIHSMGHSRVPFEVKRRLIGGNYSAQIKSSNCSTNSLLVIYHLLLK